MRALVVGLVGAVLACGVAQAGGQCVILEKPKSVFAAAGPMQRPELIGQEFRVTRTASQRKPVFVEARSTTMLLGYEAYELKGKSGTFIVRRDHVPGTPAVQPVSVENSDASVEWRGSKPASAALDHILAGPLSNLVVTPRACKA